MKGCSTLTQDARGKAPNRRWSTLPWPHPEDNREDKAKRIAGAYRELLFDITQGRVEDPAGALHRLDQHWLRHGAFWAVPTRDPYDGTEWVHAIDAAHYIDVEPGTIRKWAERGHIRVDHDDHGAPIYNIGEVKKYQAGQREARIQAARRKQPVTPSV